MKWFEIKEEKPMKGEWCYVNTGGRSEKSPYWPRATFVGMDQIGAKFKSGYGTEYYADKWAPMSQPPELE